MAARTFRKKKQQQSRVFFNVIFDVYTHVDNRETELELVSENKEKNFVGRKTWKFKAAVRQWKMLVASKVKLSGSEK